VIFIPAGVGVKYTGGGSGLTIWAAAVNAKVFGPVVAPATEEAAVAAGERAPAPALVAA
jgi:hypothetical protein